jgi:hypothetical protein
MKTVLIPKGALEKFVEIAQENLDSSGEVIETLAFLVGFIADDTITATELLFPNQTGDAARVIDNGKIVFLKLFIN